MSYHCPNEKAETVQGQVEEVIKAIHERTDAPAVRLARAITAVCYAAAGRYRQLPNWFRDGIERRSRIRIWLASGWHLARHGLGDGDHLRVPHAQRCQEGGKSNDALSDIADRSGRRARLRGRIPERSDRLTVRQGFLACATL